MCKQKLNELWGSATNIEKDVIIMAFWFSGTCDKAKRIDEQTKEFLRIIPAKPSLVSYHFTMIKDSKKSFLEDTKIDNDSSIYDIMGLNPYIEVMKKDISNNIDYFLKVVKLFRQIENGL